MSTSLMCGACGRRAGIAARGDEGQGLDRDLVVVDQRHGSTRSGWRDDRSDHHALIWSLGNPRMWPMPIECEHCGADLVLEFGEGRVVGSRRVIVVPATPSRTR